MGTWKLLHRATSVSHARPRHVDCLPLSDGKAAPVLRGISHQSPLSHESSHTMQRHPDAYLAVLDPLPDTIPCTLLDAGYQGSLVDDAVENLPRGGRGLLHRCPHMRWSAVVRGRSLAGCAHLAG